MVTLNEIRTAINNTIINALKGTKFEGVKPTAIDFTDGIPRPSIRLIFDNSRTGKSNSNLKERTLTVRVYFYAENKDRYRNDNIEMQDILENTFLEDVKVTDTFYMPLVEDGEVECEVVDTVLQCSFDLYSLEEIYDDSNLEPIEELNFNLNLEE
ncbi:hypothetical protein C1H57_08335 [Clostridium sp. 2-1]|uniref:DUF6838 family protein n=1 Tax=Candidatus Clostridium helianthi TaxID=3381660 RepID=A0ABW8SBL2_9CLOT|nr:MULTISPECIES: hypothetical protein [Clostridium]MBN7575412.1 hypothetical protein [Clostridium beijerinckii]MBN7580723.1 hypothetical protein [Clostridium beijerinckii]MBN7585176.1 hypothetical protein [Clostridium beijerinckii]MBO0522018.1 hypothetical protein [Clostridium beijerinckii]NRT77647.1 hypothetical protein [Clostridium beijerinckii]